MTQPHEEAELNPFGSKQFRMRPRAQGCAAPSEHPCSFMATNDPIFENDVSRRIVHVDMDAFYASVEQRDRPELRGRPVAVGHADGRGVVATASYEARRFGVHSAMPSRLAMELCPELVFVEGRLSHYRAVSREIHEIFRRYTDVVEPLSLDEAYLDVTHNKLGLEYGVEAARRIKADIRRELGLVASAGVSYNKFLAKIASDWRKPDGLCTIHPDRAKEFILRLKIEDFWGVGPATARRFHAMGIDDARALMRMSFAQLTREFGALGAVLYKFVRGIDNRPVLAERERKSVGCEETYAEDVRGRDAVSAKLDEVLDELLRRLQRHRFEGAVLTMKMRHRDFTTRTKSETFAMPTADERVLRHAAHALLDDMDLPEDGVRLLGLTVSQPHAKRGVQGVLLV